jgi:transcription initiation factor TFIIIB Brf1 subunit/transcription initiation factor TFIIB
MYKRFKLITNVCRQADISNMIIEEAKIVFFKISNMVSARRTKLTALMATSVIIAHNIKGIERNIDSVAQLFDLDPKILRKMVKEYERVWQEIQEKETEEQVVLASETVAPGQEVPQQEPIAEPVVDTIADDNKKLRRYLVELGIGQEYYDDVFKINKWIIESKILISHIPKSRYACLLYLIDQMYELGIDKALIIRLCDTSNVTINKCFNKLTTYYSEIKALVA